MKSIITITLLLCSIGVSAQTLTQSLETTHGMIGCPVHIGSSSKDITFDFNRDIITSDKIVITDSLKVIKALSLYIRLNEDSQRGTIDALYNAISEERRQKDVYKKAYEQVLKIARGNIDNTLKILNRKR